MQDAADANPSGMVSLLGLSLESVEKVCEQARDTGEILQVANLLCPGNIVVSGHIGACERAAELAVKEGAMRAVPLAVAGAFHTPLMESAVEQLRAALQSTEIRSPDRIVISNVDAQSHTDPDEIRALLCRQVVSPVRWEDSIRELIAQGFDRFYEVGPGRVLRGLLKRVDRKLAAEGVLD